MTEDFNKWWDEDLLTEDNPYVDGTPAYWAWEGWQAALAPVQEPSQWRDMVVVSLVREGVNKHKARELADHFANLSTARSAWIDLTDEQIHDTDGYKETREIYRLCRAIIAKIKELNT